MKRTAFPSLTLLLWVTTLVALPLNAQESGKPELLRCLFLGDRGPHQPAVRFAELAPQLAPRGIQLEYTDDVRQLQLDNLQKYDALVLYANIDEIAPAQAQALLDYVEQGGGFVPLHCASYCFRNSEAVVNLIGGQFQRHGTGVFRVQHQETPTGILEGFEGFESWDETYVHHLHNEANRTVLAYRTGAGQEKPEPWTWVRTQGQGRVFYTAWGHDGRTWTHPGFHNLVERGIRWAAGANPRQAAAYRQDAPFPSPVIKPLPQDLPAFEYVDVGNKIPNYVPSNAWGTLGENLSLMQKPLAPEESLRHLVVPDGFHVELFAAEPQLQGKPIAMNWDERGRLWVCETVDYPNEMHPDAGGRDRIRICEDTDRDGVADRFTVFAEGLSIPSSMAFWQGGVIVQNAQQTLFLKDTDGDDRADQRQVLLEGWQMGDTHGGVSNFRYGLDNWIWGMQGYNRSNPHPPGTAATQPFRQGFFRFQPQAGEIEFIRSTNNNTWGLGISEEGIIFGSTANGCPSVHMPIPNRYYERVQGWRTQLDLQSIAASNRFYPITDKVRQVDHHGGFTAAAGHSLYTARTYPAEYWNRVAFVNGPTGHLVASFVLNARGTVFRSENRFNLVASDDEWTAPIMAEIGPDGQVWIIDWYNYIVQHNPTPAGFETGKGAAYETDLRDKKYGRIYRIVADGTDGKDYPDLSRGTAADWIKALRHPTMLIRLHAQRLLVEQGDPQIATALIALVEDPSMDAIGLNVGAIHALWTLSGLGLLEQSNSAALQAVRSALHHPSAGVRRNAVLALPHTVENVQQILQAGLLRDADFQVRLVALLALADCPESLPGAGKALAEVLASPSDLADRWLGDALTSAAATHSDDFFPALKSVALPGDPARALLGVVAEHHGRTRDANGILALLRSLETLPPPVAEAILPGLERGVIAQNELTVPRLSESQRQALVDRFEALPPAAQASFIRIAMQLQLEGFDQYAEKIVEGYIQQIRDDSVSVAERVGAAASLVAFQPDSAEVVAKLTSLLTPQLSPEVSAGLIRALEASRSESLGDALLDRLETLTPAQANTVIGLLLKRGSGTAALLAAATENRLSLSDLAIDQREFLLSHPDAKIAEQARKLLAQGGSIPNADRQKVIEQYSAILKTFGDVTRGEAVFKEQCAKCHQYGDLGTQIGPNLTGMAVHPKRELLTHVLDPNRDVEANFRTYQVLTLDGVVVSGMLASESRTTIDLVDTEGKRQSLLREDIDQFIMSNKSVMPEGFEAFIKPDAMADLLEFLTQKQQFVPLSLEKVATVVSTGSLFYGIEGREDHINFPNWNVQEFEGIPFQLIDPQQASRNNAIILRGHRGGLSDRMPSAVSIPCEMEAAGIHVLGGVGGWSFPFDRQKTVSMILRLHYVDGQSEDHPWINGEHIADYIGRADVPQSKLAFELGGRQVRYLKVVPRREAKLESIELLRGEDLTAPIVFAITVEGKAAVAQD